MSILVTLTTTAQHSIGRRAALWPPLSRSSSSSRPAIASSRHSKHKRNEIAVWAALGEMLCCSTFPFHTFRATQSTRKQIFTTFGKSIVTAVFGSAVAAAALPRSIPLSLPRQRDSQRRHHNAFYVKIQQKSHSHQVVCLHRKHLPQRRFKYVDYSLVSGFVYFHPARRLAQLLRCLSSSQS